MKSRELRQEVTYRGYENLTPPGRIAATVGRTLAMKPKHSRSGFATPIIRNLVAVLCSVVLVQLLQSLSILTRC